MSEDEKPKRESRKARAQGRHSNDPKKIRREAAKRQRERDSRRGNGQPPKDSGSS